jgi:hypothetical protein
MAGSKRSFWRSWIARHSDRASRKHAGRIERLQDCQNALDIRHAGAQPLGRLGEVGMQIAGLIELIGEILANQSIRDRGE